MARFYPPGGGSSGTGGSSIDLDQITAPRRLVASGYKTLTSDSIGEIVEGTMLKLGSGEFYDGSDESPDALNLSKIYAASHTTQVGAFDFILCGYFDNSESSTRVMIPNCTPANIAAGVKVGSTDHYLMGEYTNDATATASDLKRYATMYVKGEKIEGTMPVNMALNSSINAGESVEIAEGYYPASKVTANSLSSQTVGTAVASDIKNNKTAWVNGVLVTGTMAIREALNSTMNAGDIINVPEGYYPAGKITANTLESQTTGNGIASDIKKGKTVWVNGVLVEGTMEVYTKIDTTINAGGSVTIPEGYYPASKISARSLADQTVSTAVASDIKKNKTAWVNGLLVTGSMVINAAITKSLNAGESAEIAEGYYLASKITANSLASQTAGTAIASDIKNNKTAWVNGVLVTGTMVINPKVTKSLNCGESATIGEGYILGATITANTLVSQTSATATENDLLENKTAWVDGENIEGTIPVKSTINTTLNAGGSIEIPVGYYSTAGKVTAKSLALQTVGTAIASDMKKDKTAWVNGVLVTGSMAVYAAINKTLDAGESVNMPAGYYPTSTITASGMGSQTEGTAVASDIKSAKTAWVNGVLLTGTMPINTVINATLNAGGSINIPAGYSPAGKVTAKSLADQTAGNAGASDIKSTKTAWVNGLLVTGEMPVNTAVSSTLNAGQSVTIKEGYHPAGSVKAASLASQTAGTAVASDIKKDKSAWIDGVLVTGTMAINAAIDKTINAGGSVSIAEGYYLASTIKAASLTDQTVGTAIASDIKNTKTAWVNGLLVTGTMPVRSAINSTINAGTTFDIPAGYYPASKVTAKSLADQTAGTAVASDIKKDKSAWIDGVLVTGNMPVRSAINSTINAGAALEIPAGYYPASKVTATSLADQTSGTAVASDIKNNKTAWVNGVLVTGSIPVKTAINTTLNAGAALEIPAGYYPASKVTAKSLADQTSGTAVAANILEGKTAWVNGVLVTGTMPNIAAVDPAKSLTFPTTPANNTYFYARMSSGAHVTNASSGYPEVQIPQAMVVSAGKITEDKIAAKKTILGVNGTFSSDATAAADHIAEGQTAYVNGEKITGTAILVDMILNQPLGKVFENMQNAMIINVEPRTSNTSYEATNFVVSKNLPSANITAANNGLTDMSLTCNGSILSWYEITENAENGEYECIQYIWSKYGKVILVNAEGLFADYRYCKSIDLSSFDTRYCTDFSGMFYHCGELTSLDLSNIVTSSGTYTGYIYDVGFVAMFEGCTNLTNINYGNNFNLVDNFNKLIVVDSCNISDSMFLGCPANKPTGGNWDIGIWDNNGTYHIPVYLTTGTAVNNVLTKDAENMFIYNPLSAPTSLNTDTNTFGFINTDIPADAIDISRDGDGSIVTWYDATSSTQYIYYESDMVVMNPDSSYLFENCAKLRTIDITTFNSSKVTNMRNMFASCYELESISGISYLDTSNVTNMGWLFRGCFSLTSLDLSTWNTTNVTNMRSMFYQCTVLTSVDLSSFDTSNVATMTTMFYQCTALTSLDLSTWNTSNVTTMTSMFWNCSSLTSLDVSNFNTSNVADMRSTFNKCTSLTSLDVSSFDLSNATSVAYMFYGLKCPIIYGLKFILNDTIYNTAVENNVDTNMTYGMFYDSTSDKPSDGNWNRGTWNSSGTFIKAALLADGSVVNAAINKAATTFVRSTTAPAASLTTTDISKDKDNSIVTWYDASTTTQYYYTSYSSIKMSSKCSSMFKACNKLTSIDLSIFNTSNVRDMGDMFYGCSSLTSLDVSNFDTSNVSNMSGMFYGCSKLTALNVSNFDTSNVSLMGSMFCRCSSLTSLDLSKWNTANTETMFSMFSYCGALTSLNLSNFDTSKVTSMYTMFYNCSSLTSLDLSKFKTQKVTNMDSMFDGCYELTSLNMNGWDVSNVTDMSYMFNMCRKITSLNVSTWNTSKVTTMRGAFSNCSKLATLDVSKWNTANVTNMESVFSSCAELVSLDLSRWNTSKVTTMKNTFVQCEKLTSLNISGWNTSKVTTMEYMFMNDKVLSTITYGSNFVLPSVIYNTCTVDGITNKTYHMFWNCSANKPTGGNWNNGIWIENGTFVKDAVLATGITVNAAINKAATSFVKSTTAPEASITTTDISKDKDNSIVTWYDASTTTQYYYTSYSSIKMSDTCVSMFKACNKLTSIDLSNFNTSNVYYMRDMFYGCSSLTSLDVSNFDTSKVTHMSGMFYGCSKLTALNVSNFDTSNVSLMGSMFYNCSSLTSLDLSKFKTQKVTDMSMMFYSCSSLTSLDINGWDVSNVTNMHYMFNKCRNITSLDLSKWNTSKVTNMYGLFAYCKVLTNLDVSNWNTTNVTTMQNMFNNCNEMVSLDLSKWNTSKVSNMSGMFYYCNNILSLDLSSFNTSNVTNMTNMFYYCNNILSLDLSSFNTSNVIDMNEMFAECSSLTSLNVSNFDTSKVTNMGYMFTECSSLASLNLSNFDTSKVTDMRYMFSRCSSLTSLDISNFDTSKVTHMTYMFEGCIVLSSITYGSNFVLTDNLLSLCNKSSSSNPTEGMFKSSVANKPTGRNWEKGEWHKDASSDESFIRTEMLTTGQSFNRAMNSAMTVFSRSTTAPDASITVTDISNDNNGSIVTWYDAATTTQYWYSNIEKISLNPNSFYMFTSKKALTTLDVTDFYTSKVTNMGEMFKGCSGLVSLDLSTWDTSNLTNIDSAFYQCTALTSLDISTWNTSSLRYIDSAFYKCSSLTSLDLSKWHTSNVISAVDVFNGCTKITSLNLNNWDMINTTNMNAMFSGCTSLSSINMYNFNTSNVTDMGAMFANCKSLTALSIWRFNTSKVTNMSSMFSGCAKLISLDLLRFDTSKVTNMNAMFSGCSSLTSIDVSNFNTSNVTSVYSMFSRCSELTSIDLSRFDTSKVTNMSDMFSNCIKLTSLNLNKLNGLNVKSTNMMFFQCYALETVDLSGFTTPSLTNTSYMFYRCPELTDVIVPEMSMLNVTNMKHMFGECGKLVHITCTQSLFDMSSTLFDQCIADDTANPTFRMFFNALQATTELTEFGYWYYGNGSFNENGTFIKF